MSKIWKQAEKKDKQKLEVCKNPLNVNPWLNIGLIISADILGMFDLLHVDYCVIFRQKDLFSAQL